MKDENTVIIVYVGLFQSSRTSMTDVAQDMSGECNVSSVRMDM